MMRRKLEPSTPKTTLSAEEKTRIKEISFQICFGMDKKIKISQSGESNEEESSTVVKEQESFDNLHEKAISPTNIEAKADPVKVEEAELEQQVGADNPRKPNTYQQLSLVLSCVALFRNTSIFIECFVTSGGFAFLFPYFIVLFLFGFPVSLFELGLTQYSGLSMFGAFSRMAPILTGIPYVVLCLRVFYTINMAIEPSFLVHGLNAIQIVLNGNSSWLRCNFPLYTPFNCRDFTPCTAEEDLDGDVCKPKMTTTELVGMSEFSLLMYRIANDDFLSLFPHQIYHYLLIKHGIFTQALAGYTLLIIAGYISFKGVKFFTTCTTIFYVLPLCGLIPLSIVIVMDLSKEKSILPAAVPLFDLSMAFSGTGFFNACRAVVKILFIFDGTLLHVGSISKFDTNIFMNCFLLAVIGTLYRFVVTLCIFPILLLGIKLFYPKIPNILMRLKYAEEVQNTITEILFSVLNTYVPTAIDQKTYFFLVAVVFLTINCALICYQVMTLDIITSLFYHTFPRLVYMSKKMVKFCVIVCTTTLMMALFWNKLTTKSSSVMHDYEKSLDRIYILLICFIMMLELWSVAVFYGSNRFTVNIKTMHKNKVLKKLIDMIRWPLLLLWIIAVPILGMVICVRILPLIFPVINTQNIVISLVTCIPFAVAARKFAQHALADGGLPNITTTHPRWGPVNFAHRKQAEYDERTFASRKY